MGNTNTITVVEADPSVFLIFLVWMQTCEINERAGLEGIKDDHDPDNQYPPLQLFRKWWRLVDCFILGEVILAPSFRNAAIDSLILTAREIHSRYNMTPFHKMETLGIIFEATWANSPLRRLVVDIATKYQPLDLYAQKLDVSKPDIAEFCKELAIASSIIFQASDGLVLDIPFPWAKHKCFYHDHSDLSKENRCIPRG